MLMESAGERVLESVFSSFIDVITGNIKDIIVDRKLEEAFYKCGVMISVFENSGKDGFGDAVQKVFSREILQKIYDEMTMLIDKYKPDAVAIEELFFNSNQKTAINVAQARGVILVAVRNKDVPIYEYTPLQVKQSVTGYGRADKQQIQQMVKIMLNLNVIPKPDDAADGLALAICHAHSNKMNNMFGLNKVK